MKKNIFALAAMMALACACSNDDSTTTQDNNNEGDFTGVIFATSITNPDGSSGSAYLQSLGDMTPGTYDNSNAIPFGFGGTPIVAPSGNIYTFPDYMGNSKAEILRYNLDAKGNWVKKGALAIPAGSAAANIVELNSEKAYVSMQGIGIVMAFNPTTMTKIADIDLNALSQPNTNVSPGAMVIRDGKLFVGLNQMNAQWMPEKNTIELAMIDTQTDPLEKHIVNESIGFCFATRPIEPNSIFVDENEDIYVNCIGSFGYIPGFRRADGNARSAVYALFAVRERYVFFHGAGLVGPYGDGALGADLYARAASGALAGVGHKLGLCLVGFRVCAPQAA